MARFVRSADVVARRIAGELVLVPIGSRTDDAERRTANFFVLNGTGEFLWDLLASARDADELTTELTQHFQIDAFTAGEDVQQFLAELLNCGAIDVQERS
jgi:hypothetical protein